MLLYHRKFDSFSLSSFLFHDTAWLDVPKTLSLASYSLATPLERESPTRKNFIDIVSAELDTSKKRYISIVPLNRSECIFFTFSFLQFLSHLFQLTPVIQSILQALPLLWMMPFYLQYGLSSTIGRVTTRKFMTLWRRNIAE